MISNAIGPKPVVYCEGLSLMYEAEMDGDSILKEPSGLILS